ncbi:regulatory protein, luxR family [Actinacidiphila alni]|uniref:Regulatory protein, luxR family n=1 Tax=Actinacidiphila alni TaxID=380248 RepID=A0A1I2C3M1_9ACTN|nr:LuxR family transcriptional regulator [Actinacidiphila alni]SFE62742.1 regulatory protein, luxR family [Actinacidiphila alni]
MLHGRDTETAALDELLAGARAGRSGVLVLRGEAGIGKTALLEHAVAAAGGLPVLRGTGVEFEAELPYAGLQLLLRRAMGSLAALPVPQRRALRAAFGLDAEAASEPMFVGLAVLSLLSDHAGDGGLLCVVDDAQWLDRASTDALVFAARRLDAEGVALVFAARDGEGSFAAPGLPELRLGPLAEDAALALLAERGGARADAVRAQVLAQARGNPLALLELPLAQAAGAYGAAAAAGALPLTTRLQMAFHGQVSHLPPGTQTLLLVAAADHTGDPDILVRAAGVLGVGVEDLPPAQEAGLVYVDDEDRLRFRHPLMRAAIHQRAALPDRLAAHRALAEAADPVRDPDHRAWHLAAAATGPDEAVAAALQRTAGRARERSGHAAASAAYERAARLSTDPAARVERLLLAAESASEAGGIARARAFAAEAAKAAALAADGGPASGTSGTGHAEPEPTESVADALGGASTGPTAHTGGTKGAGPGRTVPAGGSARAALDRVRGRTAYVRGLADFWEGDFAAAHQLLLRGAASAAREDPVAAARMLVQATHTAWYLGDAEVSGTMERLAALELPRDAPVRAVTDFLVRALGPGSAAGDPPDVGEAAAAARAARGGRVDPRDLVMLCGVGLALGQDAAAHDLAVALAEESRENGGVGRLTTILFFRAEAELFDGRCDEAFATASEGLRISRDSGQRQWVSQLSSALAHVAAVRGDEDACRELADEALASGTGTSMAPGAPWAYWSQGLLELGLGRTQFALDRLSLLTGPSVRHHISAMRSVPDLVEAAVRLGVPERADEPLARFEAWAARSGQGWARALVARCRALRARDAEAEAYFTQALDEHEPHRRALESARTELLYGEWLRRARRKSEARGHLKAALDTFERLGARPWADRARTELGASGASVTTGQEAAGGGRSVAEEAGLTPQESQIVRLAARGLSNRDIAAQLFLSPRTVGHHLYKAYPKLGVVSRGELAPLFPAD